jgi:hypothetical protein
MKESINTLWRLKECLAEAYDDLFEKAKKKEIELVQQYGYIECANYIANIWTQVADIEGEILQAGFAIECCSYITEEKSLALRKDPKTDEDFNNKIGAYEYYNKMYSLRYTSILDSLMDKFRRVQALSLMIDGISKPEDVEHPYADYDKREKEGNNDA